MMEKVELGQFWWFKPDAAFYGPVTDIIIDRTTLSISGVARFGNCGTMYLNKFGFPYNPNWELVIGIPCINCQRFCNQTCLK